MKPLHNHNSNYELHNTKAISWALTLGPANLFYNLFDKGAGGIAQASPRLVVLIRLLTFHVAANYASMSMTRKRKEQAGGEEQNLLQWRQKVFGVILTRKSVNYTPAFDNNADDELFQGGVHKFSKYLYT